MDFKEFLIHYLTPQDNSLRALTEFKHENEEKYQRYRDRTRRTEDFYYQDKRRQLEHGKTVDRLDADNFSRYEKLKDGIDKMLGKEVNHGE